jgi:hypothetical protein
MTGISTAPAARCSATSAAVAPAPTVAPTGPISETARAAQAIQDQTAAARAVVLAQRRDTGSLPTDSTTPIAGGSGVL